MKQLSRKNGLLFSKAKYNQSKCSSERRLRFLKLNFDKFYSGSGKGQSSLRIVLSEIRKDLACYHSQKLFSGKTRQTLRQHKQAIKEKLLSNFTCVGFESLS